MSSQSQPAATLPEHLPPSSIARLDRGNPLFRWLSANQLTGAALRRNAPGLSKEDLTPRISHTSFAATLAKHSTVCVPYDLLPEFYRRYRDAHVKGFPLYLVEKVDRTRPNILFFDLDLLFMPRDPSRPVLYDAFLDALVADVVARTFAAFDLSTLTIPSVPSARAAARGRLGARARAYILSSDVTPARLDGADAQKHGLHLFFPDLLVDETTTHTLRRHLVHHLVREWPDTRLAAAYNLLLVDDKPLLQPRGAADARDAPAAHNDMYVYQKVLDLSVCKTRQIRLPGSRKLLQSKHCSCEPGRCKHERLEHLDAKKQTTTSLFSECRRHYSLLAVLGVDGERVDAVGELARLNDPHHVDELCLALTVRRPPAATTADNAEAPASAAEAGTPFLLDDASVADTPDDPRSRRLASAPYRYRKRRAPGALPELDVDGPDARGDRLGELAGPADKPPVSWRDLFMRWAAAFFPRDFDALVADKYVECLDQRGEPDRPKRLVRAYCIVSESHCTNRTRTAMHNNKAAVLSYDAKAHVMTKKCFCKCPTALGRRFGSCASHRDVIYLPPLRRWPRTLEQLERGERGPSGTQGPGQGPGSGPGPGTMDRERPRAWSPRGFGADRGSSFGAASYGGGGGTRRFAQ